jgi:TPP-dependent pyruvate/acetoin dehydrogenase alpha subunit
MFDPELYREKGEVEAWKARDPIPAFAARLAADGVVDDEARAALDAEVAREVEAAVAFAEAGALEPVEDLARFVTSERVGRS